MVQSPECDALDATAAERAAVSAAERAASAAERAASAAILAESAGRRAASAGELAEKYRHWAGLNYLTAGESDLAGYN